MLAGLESVDFVVIFDEDKPISVWEKIRQHKNVRGGSYIPERMQEEKNLMSSWGGEYVNFELEPGISTTEIINKIIESYG